MTKADLDTMAVERIADARVLLAGQRWAFAYYVSGYAVECALKSCVLARMIHTGWVFDREVLTDAKPLKVSDIPARTHSFGTLVVLSGLRDKLTERLGDGTGFRLNWEVVSQWTEESRYLPKTQPQAEELFQAITQPTDGVLAWLTSFTT